MAGAASARRRCSSSSSAVASGAVKIPAGTNPGQERQIYEYYKKFEPWLTTLVVVRDLLVVALFAVLVWPSGRDADELDAGRPAVV